LQGWAINLARGHFDKAAFSEQIDGFIWRSYWVHCARCTLQDNERRGTEKHRGHPERFSNGGL